MSLQVWLPLNGNLNNQGLNGDAIISGTPSYGSSGKIGNGCLNASNMISIYEPSIEDKKICSFAFWAYITGSSITSDWTLVARIRDKGTNSGSHLRFEVCPPSRYNGIYCFSNHNNAGYAITNGVIASKSGGYYDQWVHFCFTSDGTTLTRYMNGVKEGTCTYNGPGYFSGYFDLANNDKCLKQDVRIYNHCLSAKEVKEISKGLICHYLMNQPEQSPNLSTIPSLIPNFPGAAGTSVYSVSTDGISRRLTCTTAGTGGRYNSCFANSARLENTTYTWSIDIRANRNMTITMGLEGGGTANFNLTTDWQRLSKTAVLLTDTYSAFVIYPYSSASVGDWIEVKSLKVEKNNFSTPWSPCSSDYPKWSDNIEYDCSGYGYNGTLSESLTYVSGSPRYDGCYYFNSASKRITLPTINMSGFSNSFSISWWGKAPSYSSLMYWGFSDGNRLNYYSGLYCNTGDSGDNPYYKPNTTTTISAPSVNTWHHFVMVGDGSSNKLYMDGELYGVAKAYRGITGSKVVINGWDSSTSYKTNGYISDFRIYSTALSASDIKELYNTSASVDKNGNMYAYEFKEE